MIKRPSVFVVGAGASVPFGFPTGAELRRRICTELRRGYAMFDLVSSAGFEEELIETVRHEFETSGLWSIDAFVGYRPQYQNVCEATIASALLPLEQTKVLTNVSGTSGNSDWYQLLWNELLSGASSPTDLSRNTVKFITFNYDRSLEQFLLNAVCSTFGIDWTAAHNALSGIAIRHVYGSLGDYTTEHGYAYGNHSDDELRKRVIAAQASIKTVPLARGDLDPEVAMWLAEAHRVYILGFGFDSTNCHRIGLADACTRSPERITPQHIYASSFNLTHADEQWCASNGFHQGSGGPRWVKGDSYALLRAVRSELN